MVVVSCKGHKKVHTNHDTLFLIFSTGHGTLKVIYHKNVWQHMWLYAGKLTILLLRHLHQHRANAARQYQLTAFSTQLPFNLSGKQSGWGRLKTASTRTQIYIPIKWHSCQKIHSFSLLLGAHTQTCPALWRRCTHTYKPSVAYVHKLLPSTHSYAPPPLHTLICEVWVVRANRLQAGLYCISVSFPTHSNPLPSLLVIKTRTKTRAASHHCPTFITLVIQELEEKLRWRLKRPRQPL